MDIRVVLKGCDAETELELVCTEEQYSFLRELAKATKAVSTYDCMPVIELWDGNYEVDEDVSPSSENFKLVEGETDEGDTYSYHELDTTKL